MNSLHLSRPTTAPAPAPQPGGPVDYIALARERNGQAIEPLARGESDPRD